MHEWRDELIYSLCLRLLSTPYKWGGDDPNGGFDCSGLVIEILKSCGEVPSGFDTTAQGLYDLYFEKAPHAAVLTFGALVFYGSSTRNIRHCAYGLDSYRVLEAGGGNREIITIADAKAASASVRIRPVDYRKDRVAILSPPYTKIGKI